MQDSLALAGFRLRSRTRADCARCQGRSRGTVSYNDEVAHCFRCGWAANRYQLARELAATATVGQASACRFPIRSRAFPRQPGVVPSTRSDGTRQAEACPTRGLRARRELERRRGYEAAIRAFARWREERLRQVSDRYWGLSRAALRAERALASGALTPAEQELAWDALARFHHAQAELSAAFDLLMCTKASAWLEDDSTIEQLFELSSTGTLYPEPLRGAARAT